MPWFSSFGSDFNYDFGVSIDEGERFSVFLRDGDGLYRTYFTSARGVDQLRIDLNLLDLTPLGRQEEWRGLPGWVAAGSAAPL